MEAVYTGIGGHFEDIFGLGFGRSEKLRLWIGPLIGFEQNSAVNHEKEDITLKSWNIYGGLALGVNIHFGSITSLSIEGRFAKYYSQGEIKDPFINIIMYLMEKVHRYTRPFFSGYLMYMAVLMNNRRKFI